MIVFRTFFKNTLCLLILNFCATINTLYGFCHFIFLTSSLSLRLLIPILGHAKMLYCLTNSVTNRILSFFETIPFNAISYIKIYNIYKGLWERDSLLRCSLKFSSGERLSVTSTSRSSACFLPSDLK